MNQLVVPAGTPVHFSLTSASVWNSFFVPQLGSMIYTMKGMTTQLNLLADREGTFHGLSTHFSGDGFSDMRFDVRSVSTPTFDAWVRTAQGNGAALDGAAYAELAKQSTQMYPEPTAPSTPDLFERIVTRSSRRDRARSGEVPPMSCPREALTMLGKLTLAAIPLDQPIPLVASGIVGCSS